MNCKFLLTLLPFIFLFSCDLKPSDENPDISDDTTETTTSNESPTGPDASSLAFLTLDKSLSRNNQFLTNSNEVIIERMKSTVQTKTQYYPLLQISEDIRNNTAAVITYIDDLRTILAEASGGVYSEEEANRLGNFSLAGMPKGMTTKKGVRESLDATGEPLQQMISELRTNSIDLVEKLWDDGGTKGTVFADLYNKERYMHELTSAISFPGPASYSPANHGGKNWLDHTFGNKSVGEIYPILQELKNNALLAESACHDFLASQMGKLEINYDKFDVLATSAKPFVLLGETFESEIALGAYSSQARFSVSVGGSSLPIVDGKARYAARATSIGEKTYTAKISVSNPLTGETETFMKEFKYTVGQPSVMVAPEKMDVIYVGVDNPIVISATGIPASATQVSISGGRLQKASKTGYIATCQKPGNVMIVVKDTRSGKSFPFEFRAKKIPNPELRIAMGDKKMDGLVRSSEFKLAGGLVAVLEDFDFDARCNVQSYTLIYTRKRQDPVEIKGTGGRFAGQISTAVKQAKPGDQYGFMNVKVRCPGDKAGRRLNGMAFKIK